jgi:hypothetical protein
MVPTEALAQMFRPPAGDRIVAGDWESLDVFDSELINVAQLGQTAIETVPSWVDGRVVSGWSMILRSTGENSVARQRGRFLRRDADGSEGDESVASRRHDRVVA